MYFLERIGVTTHKLEHKINTLKSLTEKMVIRNKLVKNSWFGGS